MAANDGIREIYRVRGVDSAAGGYAFSRLRVRRKQQKHQSPEGEEQPSERSEPESPEKDSSQHVDIQA